MNHTAADLVTLLHQRGKTLARVIETPTDASTLTEAASVSRSTIDRTLAEFSEWGLITSDADRIEPTLFARLVVTVYDDFEAEVAAANAPNGDPLWRTMAERTDAVKLLANRLDLLEYAQTPRDKRALVAEFPLARSTVNWAVRELEDTGLIQRTADGYLTTSIGQRLATRYRTLLATLADMLDAQELLATLPPDCTLPPALVTDANIERTDPTIPYHLLTNMREQLATADRIRLILPALPTPELLDVCHHRVIRHGATLELLADPALAETLTSEFLGPIAEMATRASDTVSVSVTDTPAFGLLLADSEGETPAGREVQSSSGSRLPADDSRMQSGDTKATTTVSVITYGAHGTIQGAMHTETAAAVRWAEECYTQASEEARDITDTLSNCTPAETVPASVELTGVRDTEWVALKREGFVQLTSKYFAQRAPAPPVTGWRAGFDLVDIHAGYAIDRERAHDGMRHNLTTDLTTRLTENTNLALLGPPGSGKSTVCKSVACRWYEQGQGPVFYRENGGATFSSPAVLEDHLRATDGHALVVVEDAVRAEANAIFRLMQAFRGSETVTFLLDSRESEWTDSKSFPIDAGLEAYRREAIDPITVPPLDNVEADRFINQFERTTGDDTDRNIIYKQREKEITASEGQPTSQGCSDDTPGELLLFLHRLALSADPLGGYDTRSPTTFIEDVQRSYTDLRQTSDLALDVGVLVNLLNAVGIGVTPGLVCALAPAETEPTIDEVRDALAAIEGRIIFERDGAAGTDDVSYRTIHETWSVQFLDCLLDADTERAASRRFGRCVTALLSLAADEDRRDTITAEIECETPAIDRIAAAPDEWADTTVMRLFGLGRTHRGLAALFGTTDDTYIELPNACSQTVTINCTLWRAKMAEEAGDLDRAEHELETLSALAHDVEPTDPEWASTLRGHHLRELGIVTKKRGELDTAKEYCTRALAPYRDAGNIRSLARTRMHLGVIAYARGNFETAETQYHQSLETARSHGYTQLEGITLFNLGFVVGLNDELKTAIEYFQQSLEIYRERGDRHNEAKCLTMLGEAVAHCGDLDTADSYCKQSLKTFRELGIRGREAHSLAALGSISQRRGNLDASEAYFKQSLHIRRDIGNKRSKAWTLTELGDIAAKRGDLNVAEEHCTTSRDICRDIGDRTGEASSLTVLGIIARKRGDLDTAMEHATASRTIHHETGDSRGEASSHRLLGRIACADEQFTIAEDHLTQALTDFRNMGYRYEEAETLADLGALAHAQTNHPQARDRFAEAVALYREIGAIDDTIETTEHLAAVCETMAEFTAALSHCETAYDLAQDTEFVEIPTSLAERRTHLAEHLMTDSSD